MPRVLFATCSEWAALTEDDQVGAAALRERGVEVEPARWDDASVPWAAADAVIIRSTWDYYRRIDEFRAWLNHIETLGAVLLNPLSTVRWNLDKRYLIELAGRGVPVLDTRLIERGGRDSLREYMLEAGWDDVVLKPTISAGAWRTRRVHAPARLEDQDHFVAMRRQSDVLMQRFAPEVVSEGEWSLLFFEGRFSHAVLKRPAAGDFRVQWYYGGQFEGAVPPAGSVEAAGEILKAARAETLYARVDGVIQGGQFVLMELELVEPALWLACDPGAAGRFVDAVLARLGRS